MIRRIRFAVCLAIVSGTWTARATAEEATTQPALQTEPPASRSRAASIPWQRSLADARAVSLQTGKPMLLVFGASWCRYCRKLDELTLSEAEVAWLVEDGFVPVLLDYDRDRELARKLEIKSLPCSIVLSPDADLLGRLVGYVEADRYREALLASRRLQDRVSQVRYESASE